MVNHLLPWPAMGQTPVVRLESRGGRQVVVLSVALDDAWEVEYTLVGQPRGLALLELRVLPRPGVPLPVGGLSAQVLRAVRVSAPIDSVEQILRLLRGPETRIGRELQGFLGPLLEPPAPRPAAKGEPGPGPGRRPLAAALLLRVAQAYVGAVKRKSSRAVIETAEELGETADRVRDLLNRARKRGLLTGATSGRAGGALSPKALALLKARSKKELQARSTRTRKRRSSRRKGR